MSKIYNEKKKISFPSFTFSYFSCCKFRMVFSPSVWSCVKVKMWNKRAKPKPNQWHSLLQTESAESGDSSPHCDFHPIPTHWYNFQKASAKAIYTFSRSLTYLNTETLCWREKQNPHSRWKGKNHTFSFSKYIQCQHQCCQFWPLGLIIFPVFLKTRIMCSSWQMNTLNF